MVIIFKLIDKFNNVVYIIFILNKVWLIECMNKWIKIFFNIKFYIYIIVCIYNNKNNKIFMYYRYFFGFKFFL